MLNFITIFDYQQEKAAYSAVNIEKCRRAARFRFLSRLLGGKHNVEVCSGNKGFLSRLLGGKHFALLNGLTYWFLSRLLGGKLPRVEWNSLADFLSRLLGGKQ